MPASVNPPFPTPGGGACRVDGTIVPWADGEAFAPAADPDGAATVTDGTPNAFAPATDPSGTAVYTDGVAQGYAPAPDPSGGAGVVETPPAAPFVNPYADGEAFAPLPTPGGPTV